MGGEPTLDVKSIGRGNTTSGSRKSYIRYDLAPLEGRKVSAATLDLTTVRTRWDKDDGILDFVLYGLNRGTQPGADKLGEDWNESEITWINAPANNTDRGDDVLEGISLEDGGEALEIAMASLDSTGGDEPGVVLRFAAESG